MFIKGTDSNQNQPYSLMQTHDSKWVSPTIKFKSVLIRTISTKKLITPTASEIYLDSAALSSRDRATCQSSNRLGYSSGSARDSAAFGLIYMQIKSGSRNAVDFSTCKVWIFSQKIYRKCLTRTLVKSFLHNATISETLLGRYDRAIRAASGIRLL